MAKAPQTIQEIEAAIEAARAELKVAQDKFQRKFNGLNKKYQVLRNQELAVAAVSGNLTELLQTYNTMGSNDQGYQMLKKRFPEYGNTHGLVFVGCYWPETNQYCMTVRMSYGWDETQVQLTKTAIEEALPYITPGAIKHQPTYKVFALNYGETKLVWRPDGTWALMSEKSWIKRPEREGTLEEMLRYLVQNASYGRPEPEDDYEEED